MRVDYHMHLETGPLTLEYLERFWRQAQKAGLDEIGISEHGHNYKQFRKTMEHLWTGQNTYPEVVQWLEKDFSRDLDEYVALIQEGKKQGWSLKLGLEVDYIPGKEAEIAALIDAYPWDYVLGSVHFLDKWAFDFSPEVGWPEKDVNSAYQAYFTALTKAAASGLFDSITHPDLIKIFRHRPTISLEPYYAELAAALASSDTCVEINAAGLRKPVGRIYPEPELLVKCREAGVPITLACDAHYPEDVGKGLDEAIELARSTGYTQVAIFTGRQRTLVPLS